eukprot:jgi/Psemu1/307728/fgenesh1_kg.350_\
MTPATVYGTNSYSYGTVGERKRRLAAAASFFVTPRNRNRNLGSDQIRSDQISPDRLRSAQIRSARLRSAQIGSAQPICPTTVPYSSVRRREKQEGWIQSPLCLW